MVPRSLICPVVMHSDLVVMHVTLGVVSEAFMLSTKQRQSANGSGTIFVKKNYKCFLMMLINNY